MIYDFISSAWPWISIGLIVAIVLSGMNSKSNDEAKANNKSRAFLIAAAIAIVSSLLSLFFDGFGTNFTVWLSICSMMLCIGAVAKKKERQ